jgi:hypothetical protein
MAASKAWLRSAIKSLDSSRPMLNRIKGPTCFCPIYLAVNDRQARNAAPTVANFEESQPIGEVDELGEGISFIGHDRKIS